MFLLTSVVLAVPAKNIGHFEGRQENRISGVGLVTGLRGTGDSTRNVATLDAMAEQLRDKGTPVTPEDLNSRNVALVMVEAIIPPDAKRTSELDIVVSAIGDAKSLEGGTLLETYLTGPDNTVYASAGCSGLTIGGYSAGGAGDSSRKNHPTVGICQDGARVEREIPGMNYREMDRIIFLLDTPSFGTAVGMANSVNAFYGAEVAFPLDDWSIELVVPEDLAGPRVVYFMNEIGQVDVVVELPARVVVSERTGTVVMGADVTIGAVAISHGGLTIEVDTELEVSQPNILTGGNTAIIQNGSIEVTESTGQIHMVEGTSIGDLVTALNAMGVSPRDLITILNAIEAAGALNAELIVQ